MPTRKFWNTSITRVEPNSIRVRGYDVAELMGKRSFGDVVFMLFSGELPQGNEGKLVETILVAGCDHSLAAPSADTVRFVASSGVPLQASVAAGITALGDSHGGAIEQCARIFQEAKPAGKDVGAMAADILAGFRARKERVPGYGHPQHTADPRTGRLLGLARQWGLTGPHTELALAIEAAIERQLGKRLPLNVDGAIAGVMSDMGLDWRLGKGFYVISRASGLIAHYYEQLTQEKPFKEVPWQDIEYWGPPPRPVPDP